MVWKRASAFHSGAPAAKRRKLAWAGACQTAATQREWRKTVRSGVKYKPPKPLLKRCESRSPADVSADCWSSIASLDGAPHGEPEFIAQAREPIPRAHRCFGTIMGLRRLAGPKGCSLSNRCRLREGTDLEKRWSDPTTRQSLQEAGIRVVTLGRGSLELV